MRVYKFFSKEFALKSMCERRLKISRLSQLNDPFEMLPFDISHTAVRVALSETFRTLDQIAGLMCFSRTWSNPVIWSHYADQHRGICLGFDVPDDNLKEITYSPMREPFPELATLDEAGRLAAMNRVLFTKFEDWRYENEFRVSVKLDWSTPEDGLFFMEWGDEMKLAEVIVGLRSPTCKRELERALAGYTEPVEFMRAQSALDSFAVVRDSNELRGHDDLVYFLRRGNVIHPVHFYRASSVP